MARLTVKELAERQEADKAELQKSISELTGLVKQLVEQPAPAEAISGEDSTNEFSEKKLQYGEVRINKIVANPDESVYVTYSIGRRNHNGGGYLRWDQKYRAEGKAPWIKNPGHSGMVLFALLEHCRKEGYDSLAADLERVVPASNKAEI